jgi:hypothetical protein
MSKTTNRDGTNSDVTADVVGPSNPVGPARGTPSPGTATVPRVRTETGPQIVLRGLHANQGLADKVLVEIEAAVWATTSIWDATAKAFADRPDYKTRLAACELYLAHTVGLPVQRSENLNVNATAPQNSPRRPATPALLAYYSREIEKAKRQAEKQPPSSGSLPAPDGAAREDTSG